MVEYIYFFIAYLVIFALTTYNFDQLRCLLIEMSFYPYPSLLFQNDITEESIKTLRSIRALDESSETISSILDSEIATLLQGNKRNTMLESQLEDITKLKLASETIATKKIDLAVRLYDFLDLNIKLLDNEINVLEKAIMIRGGNLFNESESRDRGTNQADVVPQKRKRGRPRLVPLPEEQDVASDDAIVTSSSALLSSSEPLYCICNRVAFGDMIACDNEDCPVEWFHYPCVNLSKKPRNSWICPLCSNKRKK